MWLGNGGKRGHGWVSLRFGAARFPPLSSVKPTGHAMGRTPHTEPYKASGARCSPSLASRRVSERARESSEPRREPVALSSVCVCALYSAVARTPRRGPAVSTVL